MGGVAPTQRPNIRLNFGRTDRSRDKFLIKFKFTKVISSYQLVNWKFDINYISQMFEKVEMYWKQKYSLENSFRITSGSRMVTNFQEKVIVVYYPEQAINWCDAGDTKKDKNNIIWRIKNLIKVCYQSKRQKSRAFNDSLKILTQTAQATEWKGILY